MNRLTYLEALDLNFSMGLPKPKILWTLRGMLARIEGSQYDVYEANDIENVLIQFIDEIR